jgi:hypothetical protein
MKELIFAITIITLFITSAASVSADFGVAGSSAQIKAGREVPTNDYRVVALENFLNKYDSPLAPYAAYFIETADKYELDWRLVPAITGVESTFGKRIPYNSYNAYGWANGAYSFESWNESINVVTKTLREKYIDKGATTINEISRIYAPPSSTWAGKVKFFMKKIDPLPLTFTLEG